MWRGVNYSDLLYTSKEAPMLTLSLWNTRSCTPSPCPLMKHCKKAPGASESDKNFKVIIYSMDAIFQFWFIWRHLWSQVEVSTSGAWIQTLLEQFFLSEMQLMDLLTVQPNQLMFSYNNQPFFIVPLATKVWLSAAHSEAVSTQQQVTIKLVTFLRSLQLLQFAVASPSPLLPPIFTTDRFPVVESDFAKNSIRDTYKTVLEL